MWACIYRRFGGPDVLEWVDHWPDPVCGPEQVVVNTAACSVNPKDGLLRRGKFRHTLARDPLPRVTGLDMAGTIVDVGEDVCGFRAGDRVYGMTNRFSGGVLAELACFHPAEIAHAPESLTLEQASAVPLAAQTALQALRDKCGLQPGHRVLITGASGGVGHFAVQIAKALGAEVHGLCSDRNIEYVTSLGADRVFDYLKYDATAGGRRYHAVFDAAGRHRRTDFLSQLASGGVFTAVAPLVGAILGELAASLRLSGRSRLVFVQSIQKDLEWLRRAIDDSVISPTIDHVYDATEIHSAHEQIQTSHTRGKIVVRVKHQS